MVKPKRTPAASQDESIADSTSGSFGFGRILCKDLANCRKGVQSIVKRWMIDVYSQNKEDGEYALVELVFTCAGYERAITSAMAKFDFPKLIDTFTKDGYSDEYGDFPLLGQKTKLKERRIAEFISELFAQCKTSLILYDGILVKNFSSFLKSASQSGYKNLRHTAVFFAMKVLSELISVEIEEQLIVYQYAEEDLDDDPTSQIDQQERNVHEARVQDIKINRKYLTEEIFAIAFRDKVERIQLLSIHEMGVWVQKTLHLLPKFGKYIFQAMIDSVAVIRIKVLEIIEELVEMVQKEDTTDADVQHFFKVALSKLLRTTLDINVKAAALAVHTIGKILEKFPMLKLSPADLQGVDNLVYNARREVACAAGMVLYARLRADKNADVVAQLARFHDANCRDYPDSFPVGTEAVSAKYLVAAMPPNCNELTDWHGMMCTVKNLEGGTDLLPFLVIVAAAVKLAVTKKNPNKSALLPEEQGKKMTEAFLPFIGSLMEECIDPVALETYVHMVDDMDDHVLCKGRNKQPSEKLVTVVDAVALRFPGVHSLMKACAKVLGKLSMANHPHAIRTINKWHDIIASSVDCVDENDPQSMENALCMIAAFGPVLPLPEERCGHILEIIRTIADDACSEHNKWSLKSHCYAIAVMYFDYVWRMVQGKKENASCLLKSVLGVVSRNQHPQEIMVMVIGIGLDTINICSPESFNESSELLLQLSDYLQKYFLIETKDAPQPPFDTRREMAVRFFKLVIVGHASPVLSAAFYKTYTMMGSNMQKMLAELHSHLWRDDRWFPSLCATMLAGLKGAYVDLYQAADGCKRKLADSVAQLARLAATVSSWLALGKNVTRTVAENRVRELGKVCTAQLEDCIRNPQIMADFCFVLAPFAAKLPDLVKRQMIKLIRKGFAGKSFAGVKELLNKLKMKNVELTKHPAASTMGNDITPSPIAIHRNLQSYGSLTSPGEESPSTVNTSVINSGQGSIKQSIAQPSQAAPSSTRPPGGQRLVSEFVYRLIGPDENGKWRPDTAGQWPSGDSAGPSGVRPIQPSQTDVEPPRRRRKPLGHSTLISQQLEPNATQDLSKGRKGSKGNPFTLEPIMEVRTSDRSSSKTSSSPIEITGEESSSVSSAAASLDQWASESRDTERERTLGKGWAVMDGTSKSGSSPLLETNECYSSPGMGGSPPNSITTATSSVQGLTGGSRCARAAQVQLKRKGTKPVANSTPIGPKWSKERPEPTGSKSGLVPIVEARSGATDPSSINTSTPRMENPDTKPHSLRFATNSAGNKSALRQDDREKTHTAADDTSYDSNDYIEATGAEQNSTPLTSVKCYSGSNTGAGSTPSSSVQGLAGESSRAMAAPVQLKRKKTKPVARSTAISPDWSKERPESTEFISTLVPIVETSTDFTDPLSINASTSKKENPGAKPHSVRFATNSAGNKSALRRDNGEPNARPDLSKGTTGPKGYPSTLKPIMEVRTSDRSSSKTSSSPIEITGEESSSVSSAAASLDQWASESRDTERERTLGKGWAVMDGTSKSGSSALVERNECFAFPGMGGSPPSSITTASSLVQGLTGGSRRARAAQVQLKRKGTKPVANSTPIGPKWSKERPEPTGSKSGLVPIVEARSGATDPSSINTSTPRMENPDTKPHSLRFATNSAGNKSALRQDDREKTHTAAGDMSYDSNDYIEATGAEQNYKSSSRFKCYLGPHMSASTMPATSDVSSAAESSRANASRGQFHHNRTEPVSHSTLFNQQLNPNEQSSMPSTSVKYYLGPQVGASTTPAASAVASAAEPSHAKASSGQFHDKRLNPNVHSTLINQQVKLNRPDQPRGRPRPTGFTPKLKSIMEVSILTSSSDEGNEGRSNAFK